MELLLIYMINTVIFSLFFFVTVAISVSIISEKRNNSKVLLIEVKELRKLNTEQGKEIMAITEHINIIEKRGQNE